MNRKKKGKILIIGGGISGIEAALELSSLGYGVFLVERSDHLGGIVPDLHRIYPVCSCCKLDPRIYACHQDPNIKVLLNTTVESITGKIGDFQISLNSNGKKISINVAGIVIATGFELFDPSIFENYSYFHPNVVTSLEYEQMQKPLGPNNGVIKRPSDGKVPERIAWIQCVGSRDINKCDIPYCSSVCCMYALKEAINTKEINKDIDAVIFYMDMRAHGKGFEEYMNKAKDLGVKFVRCRIHTIEAEGDDILIRFVDDAGNPYIEKFDMAVLSVGLRPSKDTIELAEKLKIELDEGGFIKSEPFSPGKTNIDGIFVCGGASGLFDIRQSIYHADSISALISSTIEPEPFENKKEFPEIRDTLNEAPNIVFAYFLCKNTGENIKKYIEEIVKEESRISRFTEIKNDIKTELVNLIKDTGANRLIFASCSPVVHKSTIENALKIVGLNPYLYETVDLRALNSKSQIYDAIKLAVSRIYMDTPLSVIKVPVKKHALIVGGGITGLEAALSIANQGYPVTLVEKTDRLGGHALYIKESWEGNRVDSYIKELIAAVESHDKINIMTNTTVKKNKGTAGNFVTVLLKEGKEIELTHGVTILAPGGEASKTDEYLYSKNEKVVLWSELAQRMHNDPSFVKSLNCVVFIQCVGSRDDNHSYCSNICCTFAVHTALEMKKINPNMDIFIINRDIRTYGLNEILYRKAREKGVIFIKYEVNKKPVVQEAEDSSLNVIVFDPILQKDLLIKADLISLQTAIEPVNNRELAEIFDIMLDQNGFFAESPEKMKPIDSTRDGIFIAGVANYPKDIKECIAQARAAASRAVSILKMDYILKGGMVAEVDSSKCAVCCTCVRTCPFEIPYIDHERGAAFIDPLLCRGCGICAAECPGKAIKLSYCSDQMLAKEAPAVLLEKTA